MTLEGVYLDAVVSSILDLADEPMADFEIERDVARLGYKVPGSTIRACRLALLRSNVIARSDVKKLSPHGVTCNTFVR